MIQVSQKCYQTLVILALVSEALILRLLNHMRQLFICFSHCKDIFIDFLIVSRETAGKVGK